MHFGIFRHSSMRSSIILLRFIVITLCFIASESLGQSSPGGVSSNLVLWLRADGQVYEDRSGAAKGSDDAESGDAVLSWADESGVRTNAATTINYNADTLEPPTFYNDASYNINYNAVVNFDGVKQGLDFYDDYIYSAGGAAGMEVIAVVDVDNSSSGDQDWIIDFGRYDVNGYGLSYSASKMLHYAKGVTTTEAVNLVVEPSLVWSNIKFMAGPPGYLSGFINGSQETTSGAIYFTRLQGGEINESSTHELTSGPVTIGRQSKKAVSGRYFQGNVGEVIIYSNVLSATNKEKVETYLAIKYGLTLNCSASEDYVSSSGTEIWDPQGNVYYHNAVAGIGRDDNSGLNQKQSKSSTPGSVLAMGLGRVETTNSANSNSFSSDGSYLVWGCNGYDYDFDSAFDGSANMRMGRVWKVEETGTVGDVEVQLPNSVASLSPGESLYLVLSADNQFNLADDTVRLTDDGTYFTGTSGFSDGNYFTFIKGAFVTYCSTGNTETASNGTISDGSGASYYGNDSDCDWLISVSGADSITLDFSEFVTASGDVVTVYDGTNATATELGQFSGDLTSSLPVVTSTGPNMFITFTSDGSGMEQGWSADYYSWFISGNTSIGSTSGTITDGSGTNDYGNNTEASWTISTACAATIILDFSAFNTADSGDTLNIYDGSDDTGVLLGTYYGDLSSDLPSDTAVSGSMYVTFNTNSSGSAAGWSADYSVEVSSNGTGAASKGPAGLTSNLALWLKADSAVFKNRDGASFGDDPAESGDNVLSWADASGARTNAATTNSGISPPVFYNDAAHNINFNPVLNFDASGTGLDFYDDYLFAESSPSGLEMIAVVDPDAASAGTRDFIVDMGNYANYGYGIAHSAESVRLYGSTANGGGSSSSLHAYDDDPVMVRGQIDFGYSKWAIFVNGGDPETEISGVAGLTQLTCDELWESPVHGSNFGPLTIGRQSQNDQLISDGRMFEGNIAEVIIFDKDLSTTEEKKIQTYLALKYGITTGRTVMPFNDDYISSSGTVIWSPSTNGAYHYNIAGIGRDDDSGLNQKQSQSANAASVLAIGLGEIAATNADNANTFGSDETFLVWGHNNGDTSFVASFEGNPNARMSRYWKLEDTNATGTVEVRIPNTLTTLGADESMYLVASTDGSFSLSDDTVRMTDDGTYYTCTYDFADNASSWLTFHKGSYITYCITGEGESASNGTIEDGSGAGLDYGNSTTCDWLISIAGADSITLDFTTFVTYDASDYVKVYDGTDNTGTLLATLSGDLSATLPAVTNTSSNMFIEFITDGANREAGWSADYYAWYINGHTDITSNSGTLTDGSGSNDYGNNTTASWLINPDCAGPVIIDFTAFNTADSGDTLNIYDGTDDTGILLGSYYGDLSASLPSDTATSSSMYITFTTTASGSAAGWSADYSSSVLSNGTGAATIAPVGFTGSMAMWLRADSAVFSDRSGATKGSTSASSGGLVNSWADISGARTNAATTINGLTAPKWYDDPTYNINFNPVVRYDAGDQGLDFYDDYLFLSGSGAEIIAVMAPDAAISGSQRFVLDLGNNADNGYGLGYSSDSIYFYGAGGGAGSSTKISHSYGDDPVFVRSKLDFGSDSYLYQNEEGLSSFSSNSLSDLACSELQVTSTHEINAGPLTIGRQSSTNGALTGNRTFRGNIAELIFFDNHAPFGASDDMQRVWSYVSIKYGITPWHVLSTVYDLLSSSGIRIYNILIPANYNANIAGIGRDDASQLNQKQSQSVNSGSLVAIGLGDIEATNSANANEFAADESFLIWGAREGSTSSFNSSFECIANARMNRSWKAEETGTVGDVKIRIPNTVATLAGDEYIYLVASSDRVFSLADDTVRLTDDGTYFVGTYDFSGGRSYFTFAKGNFDALSGGNLLTDSNGSISDGSGSGTDYGNFTGCEWLISVTGADSINLDFDEFITAVGDTVFVYDGDSESATPLDTLTGDLSLSLPSIISSGPDIYLTFTSNETGTAEGWSATYYSSFLGGNTEILDSSGTIDDGSGPGDYGNNNSASWTISTPCAISIVLDFTSFVTADIGDTVNVYDGVDETGTLLGRYWGDLSATLPSDTATSGSMYITFSSNKLGSASGWSADYTVEVASNGTGVASNAPAGLTGNLALWLRADQQVYEDRSGDQKGTDEVENGDGVQSWADVSAARANDATTINGLGEPTWHNHPDYNINFNPVLRFDGTDDGLDFYDDYLFSENDGLEILAVVKPDEASGGSSDMIVDLGMHPGGGYGLAHASDSLRMYGGYGYGGKNYKAIQAFGADPVFLRGAINFGSEFKVQVNHTDVIDQTNTLTQLACDEIDVTRTHETNTGPLTIGRQSKSDSISGRLFRGDIAEVIVYDKHLPAAEEQKIRSYLAIKYGITTEQAADADHDYVSSSGIVIWDATTNASYHNGIAGIGRDDDSGLNQKQSRSVNTGTVLTMGLGDIDTTNTANASSFTADESFMLWGHDAASSAFNESFDGNANKKIAREWKISETGTVGTAKVGLDAAAVSLTDCEKLYLVVDDNTDGNFTTVDTMIVMIPEGDLYTCSYNFSDDDLFTFAKYEGNVFLELPGYNTTVVAEEHCTESGTGFSYFYDLNDPEKLRFAIQKFPGEVGANTNNFDAIVTVTTRKDPTTSEGVIARTDNVDEIGAFYLGRYWNVDLADGSLPLNGWVNVRFYFDLLDTVRAQEAAVSFNSSHGGTLPLSNLRWFKSLNESFDTTKLGVMGYEGLKIFLNDFEYGAEDGIQYVEFKEVSSFSGGGGMFGVNNGTLPVELLSFTAEREEDHVKLDWITATEENTEKFIVQRSGDLQNWTEIGEQQAVGFSDLQRTYQLVDHAPALGLNYYRLKMVDFDGYTEFSSNRFVMFEFETTPVQLYPNPARDQFHVIVPVRDVWFEMSSALGRIETIELELRDGHYTFNTHHLARGVYFLKVHMPEREETIKVMIE